MAHNILIVDDSATTRAFIRRTIGLAGFPVADLYEAGDGAAALGVLAARRVDLVVTDLHMPTMDGIEMTRRMRADPACRDIPVVVITADPNTDRLDRLREAGVKGYLRKPFTPESVRGALELAMGGIRA